MSHRGARDAKAGEHQNGQQNQPEQQQQQQQQQQQVMQGTTSPQATKLAGGYVQMLCHQYVGKLACGDHFDNPSFPWAIWNKDSNGKKRKTYPDMVKKLRDCIPPRMIETVEGACHYHVPRDTYHTHIGRDKVEEYDYDGIGDFSSEESQHSDR